MVGELHHKKDNFIYSSFPSLNIVIRAILTSCSKLFFSLHVSKVFEIWKYLLVLLQINNRFNIPIITDPRLDPLKITKRGRDKSDADTVCDLPVHF